MFGMRGSMNWFKMNRLGAVVSAVLVLSFLVVPATYPAKGQAGGVNRGLSAAVDHEGQPWAVWEVADGHDVDVYYSHWSGDAWRPAHALSASPGVVEHSPSVAFANGGTVPWVAWSASRGIEQSEIVVSRWIGDGWSPPVTVPGTKALRGDQPFLAAGPDGTLWLAWIGQDGVDSEVYASRWDGANWSDPWQVGRDDQAPQAYDTHPRLAMNATGKAWLVWASYEGSLNDEIHSSYWDGSAWSPQQRVSASDDTPDVWPAVVLDAAGQPWVAWQGAETEGIGRWRIYLSHWDRSSSSWSSESLVSSPPYQFLEERRPDLVFDSAGRLHLAWAVAGESSGFARTSWDGKNWALPAWVETGGAATPALLAVGDESWLVWLALNDGAGIPLRWQNTDEVGVPLSAVALPWTTMPDQPGTAVPNRHLAHGDSITWAQYNDLDGQPVTPYPVFLEALLDNNVIQSEVINHGKPGEKARAAEARLREGIQTHNPEFVEIMEGTNDLSGEQYSPAETAYAVRLLVRVVKEFPGTKVMIATIIPRRDKWNGDVNATNQLLYTKVAQKEKVPIADPWQAYYNYGPWEDFYVDLLHPGTKGLEILANTFFQKMVSIGWLPEDPNPPTARITSLPAKSGCFVPVNWDGDDGDGSGIASFDLQVSANGGAWMDWLNRTPQFYGFYVSPKSQTLSVRVRARDNAGNVGDYGAPDTTEVVCSSTIERVYLPALGRQASH